jgi:rare lipoprotein A
MSDDTERGESYLEIQMDRWTIALAAIALVVLLVGAFLLGSWTASRAQDKERRAAMEAAPAAAAVVEDEGHDAAEPVDAEGAFGPSSVSARGAAPLTQVPPPPVATAPTRVVVEDVSSPAPPAPKPRATAPARASAPARSSVPAKASAVSTAAAATPDAGSWVVQVAAVAKETEADALKDKLSRKGYPVRVVLDAGWFKVQAGPFASKSEARVAEQRLKREERLATWLKPA